MDLKMFIDCFADEFDETDRDEFTPTTIFKDLEEWDSLTSLSVITMIDEQMEVRIKGSDLRSCDTIEDLYKLASDV